MSASLDIDVIKARAGGYAALAKALGLSRATVWGWREVPPKHVIAVERETGIPRHLLRPDLYPDETNPKEAA